MRCEFDLCFVQIAPVTLVTSLGLLSCRMGCWQFPALEICHTSSQSYLKFVKRLHSEGVVRSTELLQLILHCIYHGVNADIYVGGLVHLQTALFLMKYNVL